MTQDITAFQSLQILGFFVVHGMGITWAVSRLVRRVEEDCSAKREADRKEHEKQHLRIWGEMDAMKAAHMKDIRELEQKIGERPDRTAFEDAMEKLEKRLEGRFDQLLEVIKARISGAP